MCVSAHYTPIPQWTFAFHISEGYQHTGKRLAISRFIPITSSAFFPTIHLGTLPILSEPRCQHSSTSQAPVLALLGKSPGHANRLRQSRLKIPEQVTQARERPREAIFRPGIDKTRNSAFKQTIVTVWRISSMTSLLIKNTALSPVKLLQQLMRRNWSHMTQFKTWTSSPPPYSCAEECEGSANRVAPPVQQHSLSRSRTVRGRLSCPVVIA